MKKRNVLIGAVLGIAAISLAAMQCSKEVDDFPNDPQNNQTYTCPDGSTGIYNGLMNYWIISSIINGRSTTNRFYPSTGSYTDNNGKKIAKPNYFTSTKKVGGFGRSGRSATS